MNGMKWKMAWKLKKIKKLNENYILDLFISVPIGDMKKDSPGIS